MSDPLLYKVSGRVGTITINRPEARNALTFEMYDRIAEICAAVPGPISAEVTATDFDGMVAFSETPMARMLVPKGGD